MKNRIECSESACKWTGTESEMKQKKDPEFSFAYTYVCPKCGNDTYYELAAPIQCERVDHINQLIKIIASYGRKFFDHKGTIATMEKDAKGKVWFVDEYTRRRIYVAYKGLWKGFNHGGTLRNLVEEFYRYIKTGEQIDIRLIGLKGFRTDGSNIWGYPPKDVVKMRRDALKLPCCKEY